MWRSVLHQTLNKRAVASKKKPRSSKRKLPEVTRWIGLKIMRKIILKKINNLDRARPWENRKINLNKRMNFMK